MDEVAKTAGIRYEVWDAETCQNNLGVPFKGAFFDPQGANLNPYKLARGILEKVLGKAENVRVFEGTVRPTPTPKKSQVLPDPVCFFIVCRMSSTLHMDPRLQLSAGQNLASSS